MIRTCYSEDFLRASVSLESVRSLEKGFDREGSFVSVLEQLRDVRSFLEMSSLVHRFLCLDQ